MNPVNVMACILTKFVKRMNTDKNEYKSKIKGGGEGRH